jgi:hypothetical protein
MSGARLAIELADASRAELLETDGERVTLSCARAHPPGSTLHGSSAIGALCIKIRSSTRVGDGYRVEGRFVNLSRSQRAALAPR